MPISGLFIQRRRFPLPILPFACHRRLWHAVCIGRDSR
ncbi:hypothetical protein [Azospirillum argentinense]